LAREGGNKRGKGVSLAKGPVGIIGLLLGAYGLSALFFGGHSFATHPLNGTVNGKTWLGLEVNGWSSLLFVAAGALLLFGSARHWGAKSVAIIVGLGLGAASLIALYDKTDVFGIFAANGWTKLAWGASAIALLLAARLPRVGRKRDDAESERRAAGSRRPRRAGERAGAVRA
jgi:hypothetical protein